MTKQRVGVAFKHAKRRASSFALLHYVPQIVTEPSAVTVLPLAFASILYLLACSFVSVSFFFGGFRG